MDSCHRSCSNFDSNPIYLPFSLFFPPLFSADSPFIPRWVRWNPTKEQLRTLENVYNGGNKSPRTEQIQHITAELRRHGNVAGINVFYWFKNRKARERRRLKTAFCPSHSASAATTASVASSIAFSDAGMGARAAASSNYYNDTCTSPCSAAGASTVMAGGGGGGGGGGGSSISTSCCDYWWVESSSSSEVAADDDNTPLQSHPQTLQLFPPPPP
uniref:HD transcription factor n=1 Tax=Gnetum gnemon TaxID=3382 RepID=S6CY25_GNEGN|nr:HD transcription factor [Gnetum gnemon]